MYGDQDKIETLVGKTLSEIDTDRREYINFVCPEGTLTLFHSQDCCECVEIESIVGDLDDLLDTPILVAEERISGDKPYGVERDWEPENETWTFYTFRTIKGTVDIRWHGTSNGYYSESVNANWMPT